jgi:spore coat polysaccharide biosynthesis protein SpsF
LQEVIAIIQARTQSTRLPGKVLFHLPEPHGKTVLEHVVERLRKSKYTDAIVIAIPEGESDKALWEKANNIEGVTQAVRGSEENVLQRFLDAADLCPSEYIVRVTSDNPLIDALVVDEAIMFMKKNPSIDYVYTSGLPLGLGIEVVKANALKASANLSDLNDTDREHVTCSVHSRRHIFNVADLALNGLWNNSLNARFTLDTFEDYTFLNAVFYGMNLNNYPVDIEHLEKLLLEAPWMVEINRHVKQNPNLYLLSKQLLSSK